MRVSAATGASRGWAFAIVAISVSLLLALAGWEVVPRVADQVSQLIHSIPQSMERLQHYLEGREWGQTVLGYIPNILASTNLTQKLSTLLRESLDGLAGLVVIAVVGLYLGANPAIYEQGLLKLFSADHRDHARNVLDEVAYTLRWWLIGQLIPMAVLGVATGIGLLLLHVHPAFTLALFTAFMIFIPYIGSVIALVVACLVTLMQGSTVVLYVALLYVGVHSAEGYLLTPMVQRRMLYIPPGLIILSQFLMGVLLGFPGLALATPLTASALVLVKMLWLHESPQHHG